jgi:hypothetical protein
MKRRQVDQIAKIARTGAVAIVLDDVAIAPITCALKATCLALISPSHH